MLARAARLVKADDYRATVRRGRRSSTENLLMYTVDRGDVLDARFGFIVSRGVGNAVSRNRVRRRLKAVCSEIEAGSVRGLDIVIRAHPPAAVASWGELRADLYKAGTKFGIVSRETVIA